MKIFGILAYPVYHSLSPQMHNSAILEEKMDAMYTRFGIAPPHLEKFFLENFRESQKISGLSVSVPHKETCQQFLDEIDEAGKKIGAVNTIFWKKNDEKDSNKKNILCGTNTDYLGFAKSLAEHYDISQKKILVLGAGGATKAILYALENMQNTKNKKISPAKISLWNRSTEKAQKLAEIFSVKVVSGSAENLEKISDQFDLVINTTSLGMEGEFENVSPLPKNFWKKSHTAFDIVYTPLGTKFLRECRAAGGTGISGEKMLLFQGIAQFEIFSGKKVSQETQEVMERAINLHSKFPPLPLGEGRGEGAIYEEKKNILATIVAHKKTELFASLEFLEQKLAMGEFLFSKKLREKKTDNQNNPIPHLIAEIKPASPSKGKIFRAGDTPEKIAQMYEENGVSCISVLTDNKFFGASAQNLQKARKILGKEFPLLRKDFIIHAAQIFEARYLGADAVLLMKSILSAEQIQEFLQICKKLGMDALVEVHDEEEFTEVITKTSAEIIGVNSRDLKTLNINPKNFQNILDFGYKHFPEKMNHKIFVSESGIASQKDIQETSQDANAILVGTGILLEKTDKLRVQKIRELSGEE
jgi:shikimate dehydrogenase